jgi:hypothetical protein
MTAASVLSLCISLIARSPPDSSRSPHNLSPPPTPPHPGRRATNIAAPAATASSSLSSPRSSSRSPPAPSADPATGLHISTSGQTPRGLKNAAAGMSPLRPLIPDGCFRRGAATLRASALRAAPDLCFAARVSRRRRHASCSARQGGLVAQGMAERTSSGTRTPPKPRRITVSANPGSAHAR